MKTIVIIPCGPTTCHESWINTNSKNVDFAILWYSDELVPEWIKESSKFIVLDKGSKWTLIRNFLKMTGFNNNSIINNYDYFWMPDDDLLCVKGTVEELVSTMHKYKLDLAQPSLIDKNVQWKMLLNKDIDKDILYSNFVEIQAPCFSKKGLKKILKTLLDDKIKTGWGLDYIWPVMLNFKGIGIINNVIMEHTRPSKKFDKNYQGGQADPFKEFEDNMKRYKIRKFFKKLENFSRN